LSKTIVDQLIANRVVNLEWNSDVVDLGKPGSYSINR